MMMILNLFLYFFQEKEWKYSDNNLLMVKMALTFSVEKIGEVLNQSLEV